MAKRTYEVYDAEATALLEGLKEALDSTISKVVSGIPYLPRQPQRSTKCMSSCQWL